MNRITEIQERLAKATPGKWKWTVKKREPDRNGFIELDELQHSEDRNYGTRILCIEKNRHGIDVIGCWNAVDAELIANAPDDIAYLLSKVKRYEGYFEDIVAESSDIYAIRKARAALTEQEE